MTDLPCEGDNPVFWSILHRSIFLELVRVFLLALCSLTGLLLMAGVVAEASQRGLAPGQVLSVIPLLIPGTLPYTIPTTTLFAVCLVYGRLAADNEVLALKAAGINMIHAVWPALLLGLATSGTTLGMYLYTIPGTHHQLRSRIADDVEDFLYSMLKREGCIQHPKINYEIHVKRVEGRKLIDAIFKRRDPNGREDVVYDIIAHAREAELEVDTKRKEIMVHMRHCHIKGENGQDAAFVQDKMWPVEMPEDFTNATKQSAREMTWWELDEWKAVLEDELAKMSADIAAHQAVINQGTAPANFKDHVYRQQLSQRYKRNLIASIRAEYHVRPGLALGCLCFVLLGCPVGVWFSRSDYLSAFITCFLPIVIVYYPLLLCGINLAKTARIDPFYGIWGPNLLMIAVACPLFWRMLRR